MKQLYWIDDSFEDVYYIAQGAISKLWELKDMNKEGIASKVLIFGNDYKFAGADELPTEEDEREDYQRLFDLFLEACMEEDGPNIERPVFKEKRSLIQDPIALLYKKEIPGDLEAYQAMKENWISKNLSDLNVDNYIKAIKEAESLIERMKISPNSVVGIDIALLYDDLKRLQNKQLILSMELCHRILGQNIPCFMYSSAANDDILRKNWEEIYSSFYDNEEIKIYNRSDLMQKGNNDIVREIEEMFEEKQEVEVHDNGKDNMG